MKLASNLLPTESYNTPSHLRNRPKRLRIFHGYQNMFDQVFILAFSKPGDIRDMLRLFLPGIVVQQGLITQGRASLYGLEMDILERISKSTLESFSNLRERPYRYTVSSSSSSSSSYVLEHCLSEFLRDSKSISSLLQ